MGYALTHTYICGAVISVYRYNDWGHIVADVRAYELKRFLCCAGQADKQNLIYAKETYASIIMCGVWLVNFYRDI